MKLHFLVEGPSEAAFLEDWLPRLLRGHELKVHPHEGKGSLPRRNEQIPRHRRGLLDQLPAKLRAYGTSLDHSREAVVVQVDADEESCVDLRRRLAEMLSQIDRAPKVLLRIAIEELEAFYLGDLAGLERAYPECDTRKARAYSPDSVCGTAELFDQVIGDGGMNKVSWAKAMGPVFTTTAARSRSPSFKKLVAGLLDLVARSNGPPTRKRKWRHRAKPKPGRGRA